MAKKQISKKSLHMWRLCPLGTYFRKGSFVRAYTTTNGIHISAHKRASTCALNPTKKDQLYSDEITEIAQRYFTNKNIKILPIKSTRPSYNNFDLLIAGWTQYWNEVLNPSSELDPNFVKALIDSESSFNPNSGKTSKAKNKAMGLMQIRNQARQILADEKGEIKDHYITITNNQLYDANINICAGIRWLFHKQELSSRNSKTPLTWTDAVVKYKGLDLTQKRDFEVFNIFLSRLKEYSK